MCVFSLFYRLEIWKHEIGGFPSRNVCFKVEKFGEIWSYVLFFFLGFFLGYLTSIGGKNKWSLSWDLSTCKISWEDWYVCPCESYGDTGDRSESSLPCGGWRVHCLGPSGVSKSICAWQHQTQSLQETIGNHFTRPRIRKISARMRIYRLLCPWCSRLTNAASGHRPLASPGPERPLSYLALIAELVPFFKSSPSQVFSGLSQDESRLKLPATTFKPAGSWSVSHYFMVILYTLSGMHTIEKEPVPFPDTVFSLIYREMSSMDMKGTTWGSLSPSWT